MGSHTVNKTMPLRVVIDTNVVLSSLLFKSGRMRWLSAAWHKGEFIPLVSRESVIELLRVLAYPKFQLTDLEQKAVLGAYLPFAETVHIPTTQLTDLPECRDIDDIKFLALAHIAKADCLVTGDSDLLVLATQTPFSILTPDQFKTKLNQ